MQHAEASGKTVDDALKAAVAKLNATKEEVEFVVLDEGQRGGLFGRGARDAVVRATLRADGPDPDASTPEPPDTSIPRRARGRPRGGSGGPAANRERGDRDRGRRGGRGGRGGRSRGGSGGPGGGRERGDRGDRNGGRRMERAPELTEQDFFGEGSPPPAREPSRRGSGGSGGSGGGGGSSRRSRPRRRREEEEIAPDINAEEVDLAAEVVDSILQILEIDAEISIREPVTAGDGLGSARAVIDISGDDLGMLIGRRGESLMAFQYVVNLVMTRRFPGRGSVTIDVEQYRSRREEQVVALAGRMADRVRETGDPITLEPMSAAERRLVHLSLAEDPELETNSTGEGESRKVVISLMEE